MSTCQSEDDREYGHGEEEYEDDVRSTEEKDKSSFIAINKGKWMR
jgi:hypothetical protein